jgi:anti-sigma regulatory factor (Ser/Thr protein kinase)
VTVPITLRIPNDKQYHGVARLVVGGLAARLELSYEDLEDLQLALESVLEDDGYAVGHDVTVELAVGDDTLDIRIGPLNGARIREDLARADEESTIGLGRLLATVVQDVSIEERADGEWLRLEKDVRIVTPS